MAPRPENDRRSFVVAEAPGISELAAPDEWRRPTSRGAIDRLQEAAAILLRKYVDRYYQKAQQRWESDHMRYEPLTVHDGNFQPYRVTVPRSDPALVKAICETVEEAWKLARRRNPEKLYAGEYAYDLPDLR